MSLLRPQATTRDALRNAYVRLRTPKDLAGGKGSPALPPWTVSDSNRTASCLQGRRSTR